MALVSIDPITRIEGHLRVEIEVDSGVVKDAWVSGSMYRGMETVLQNRAPADAFYISQRICGVCPISHGHASTMASENALGIKIPNNARIIRNIIEGAETLHSHVLWFYTLTALDYVDVVSALSANIADTYALAEKAGTTTADFGGIQKRLKDFVAGGQLSIFTNGYWGHPAMKLPPELNLIAVAHYLEALQMQAEAAEIIAIMGGKFPHFMTSIPGGTAFGADRGASRRHPLPLAGRLRLHHEHDDPGHAGHRAVLSRRGRLRQGRRQLSWRGAFSTTRRLRPEQARTAARRSGRRPDLVQAGCDAGQGVRRALVVQLRPAVSTRPRARRRRTSPPTTQTNKYSWVKAPRSTASRWKSARCPACSSRTSAGVTEIKTLVDGALAALSKAAGTTLGPTALLSLLGRVAARNLEAKYVADQMGGWITELVAAVKSGDSTYFTATTVGDGEGAGLWEAPRGALGHWVTRQGREDRELPGRRSVHVGHVAARCSRRAWTSRRGSRRRADRRPDQAARSAAHRAQLRSLTRVRGSRD